MRGPIAITLARGAHQVRLLGEHAQLGVVHQDEVDRADRRDERVARRVDPEVHRVEADEPGAGALLAHLELEVGLDVGEEQRLRGLRLLRELRLEVAEHVQLRVVGVGDVEVVVVVAAPEERLAAGDVLDVVGVDAARCAAPRTPPRRSRRRPGRPRARR